MGYEDIVYTNSTNGDKFERFVNCRKKLRGRYITEKEWANYKEGENFVFSFFLF